MNALDIIKKINTVPEHLRISAAHKSCQNLNNIDTLKLLTSIYEINELRDTTGRSLLHTAAVHLNKFACEYLLSINYPINDKDDQERTPLHLASTDNKYIEIAEFLLSKDAYVDSIDIKNQTPLYYSAFYGSDLICSLLLKYGANKNIPDDIGQEPLRVAIKRGNSTIVNILSTFKN